MADAELLEETRIHPGRVVDLRLERVRIPNGAVCDFEVVRHPGAAVVLPLFVDGTTVLLRQYRHAAGGWLLEAPAGKLEPGEDPAECARRELEEETGWVPGELEEAGVIWTTPGFCDERIWLYLARDLERGTRAHEEDEVIETRRMSLREAVEMARTGVITDAKTICVLFRAASALSPREDSPRDPATR